RPGSRGAAGGTEDPPAHPYVPQVVARGRADEGVGGGALAAGEDDGGGRARCLRGRQRGLVQDVRRGQRVGDDGERGEVRVGGERPGDGQRRRPRGEGDGVTGTHP